MQERPTGWVIRLMRRTGLIWNVVAITPERQQEKLAGASAHREPELDDGFARSADGRERELAYTAGR